jgi:hypothetical protein
MQSDDAFEDTGELKPMGQEFACPRASHHESFGQSAQELCPVMQCSSVVCSSWPDGHDAIQLYVEFPQLCTWNPLEQTESAFKTMGPVSMVGSGVVAWAVVSGPDVALAWSVVCSAVAFVWSVVDVS